MTFVTNSDAHSLPKIAREYNKIQVEDISFKEIVMALKNEGGRKVLAARRAKGRKKLSA